MGTKRRPGEVRDAILAVLSSRPDGASLTEIETAVRQFLGDAAPSSVRSYLRLNTPEIFRRNARGFYALRRSHGVRESVPRSYQKELPADEIEWPSFSFGKAKIYNADCFDWLRRQVPDSIHAVVTDPPYGLFEYTPEQQAKLRTGRGGVWRIPPSFDGTVRSPLPRFTVLTGQDLRALDQFFFDWARLLCPALVPGANVVVASNPLLSYIVAGALARAGLERRGELVRLVMTMRGGDRPKAAHTEFPGVSVMPRSMWEPWLLFRKPIDGRVQDNLRRWKTGGFRRPENDRPFGDVIPSSPTHKSERSLAPHPSLKPQEFLRSVVRGVLPLGEGVILDPFAGSGSTLAAAEAVGYSSVGIEKDTYYFDVARKALPRLAAFKNGLNYTLNSSQPKSNPAEPECELWLCFFRGLNVFGHDVIPMSDLERRCQTAFVESGLPLSFLEYYGSTGNVAILASGIPASDIRRALSRAVPKPCALVQPEIVEQMDSAFSGWPAPTEVPGFRWTPGVSLLCDGHPGTGDLTESGLGMFKRISPAVVLLYRKERATVRGTLHPDRKGGWAAVSRWTGTRLGGSWTARSFNVLQELLSQARQKLAVR